MNVQQIETREQLIPSAQTVAAEITRFLWPAKPDQYQHGTIGQTLEGLSLTSHLLFDDNAGEQTRVFEGLDSRAHDVFVQATLVLAEQHGIRVTAGEPIRLQSGRREISVALGDFAPRRGSGGIPTVSVRQAQR